jgi:ubiquinone/menaquinone biosynthesis C-methylase UbiE
MINAALPVAPGGPGEQDYTLLDVATCFGFFPFFLATATSQPASTASRIVGCDLNPALINLACGYARQQQRARTEFVMADILADDITALRSHLQATTFDIVTAIHLLEHLEEAQMTRALANLWQLTARRLIIAVPLEEVPDPRFGHVQTFTREKLHALGQRIAGTCQYQEYHGGWLVLDRQPERQGVLSQPPAHMLV